MKAPGTRALLIALAVLTGSCSDDDQPAFLIKAYVKPLTNDHWVILSDEDGRLLDYKQVLSDGVVEFKGFPHRKVIYTTFVATGWGYILHSIQAVPIGTELTVDTTHYPSSVNPPVQGNASFAIHDISFNAPSLATEYLISSVEFGAKYWTNTTFGLVSPEYQNSTLSFGLPLQSSSSDVMGIGYRDGLPVYQWFRDVGPGDEISASFSNFLPMKTIPINKQVVNFGVVGMYGDYLNGGVGYSLSRFAHWYFSGSTNRNETPMPGYIDGFDNYWINVTLNTADCCHFTENTFFDSFGPIPATIDLPDYTYALKSQSFSDFSFTFSNDYTYQDAFFTVDGKRDSQTDVWWNVNAPAGDKIVEIHIPTEIRSKYPGFKTDRLKLNMLTLTNELGGESYSEIIFKPIWIRKHFKKLTYQFEYE